MRNYLDDKRGANFTNSVRGNWQCQDLGDKSVVFRSTCGVHFDTETWPTGGIKLVEWVGLVTHGQRGNFLRRDVVNITVNEFNVVWRPRFSG